MLKLILILIFVFTTYGNLCFSNDFVNETKELIKTALIFNDPNPIHSSTTQEAYTDFVTILKSFGNSINQIETEPHHYFDQIVKNSSHFYDDRIDQKRMNYRRAMYFSSLALSFEYERGITFLEYAKFSLTGSFENPHFRLHENKILGLMLLELLMIYETSESGRIDSMVKIIQQFIQINLAYINEGLAKSTFELLLKLD